MTKQKWGGFQRRYATTVDRDPWPHVPFASTDPFHMTKGDKWFFGLTSAATVFGLVFGGYFGWAW